MDTRIGPYEIQKEVGRGGMGVVYLGRDTRLERDVAIKALPEHLAEDPARLERFEREARTLAGLTHPNVAGIYGVEEQGGAKYLVLEYVDGETLADVLDRGPLAVDDAVEIAIQIAAGVEAAHEAGVIHRDLKPANIKITSDGKAKVLDFGLARADDSHSSSGFGLDSPTMTTPQHSPTIAGAILGTAAYMSPEQARGRRVDKRTDIWSFGVLLYEMLTGAGPFQGETATDSIGAILHKDVDLDRLPPSTPASVRHVLARCLVRDKEQRYRDIGDIRLDLSAAGGEISDTEVAQKRNTGVVALLTVALLVVAAGWILSIVGTGGVEPHPPVESVSLTIPLPDGMEVDGTIAITRDGKTIAFEARDADGRSHLYLRHLDSYEVIEVPGSQEALDPFFSPDGESLGFFRRSAIWRVPISGGTPRRLRGAARIMGAVWLDDDTIVYSEGVNSALKRMTSSGNELAPLTSLEGEGNSYAHVWPQYIPGTSKVLYSVWGDPGGGGRLVDIETGELSQIVLNRDEAGAFVPPVRWSASGHLIFEGWDTGLQVHAYEFGTSLPVAYPDARQLLDSVSHLGNSTHSMFALSDTGTFAYVPSASEVRHLVWVSEDGTVERVLDQSAIADITRLERSVDLSRDGTRALVGNSGDIAEIDLIRKVPRRVTNSLGNNVMGHWSADESHVIFSSNLEKHWSIWRAHASGVQPEEMLLQHDSSVFTHSVGPDDEIAYIELSNTETGVDIWILESDGTDRPLVQTDNEERNPSISPDGKWVAYQSDTSGQFEIYVIASDGSGRPLRVTLEGGRSPKWGPTGETLYYRVGRGIRRVGFSDGALVGEPVTVFDAPNLATMGAYAVSPDETRMLAVQVGEDSISREIRVITNYFDEIRRVAGMAGDRE